MLATFALLAVRLVSGEAVLPAVEPARAAVARLEASLGRPVAVERALGGIPVLVDAPGLAPGASLKALVVALHASLVADGKALRIERTAADRRAVAVAHAAANRERIAGGLARWGRILARADRLGDAAAQVRAARTEVAQAGRDNEAATLAHRPYAFPTELMGEAMVLPVGRLLHGLLARLGPDRLAALDPGEIRFLSDRPNAAEAALPPCADLVAAYAATQEGYAASTGLPASEAPPAKVVLSLNEANAGIDLYDARGRRIDRGAMSYRVEVFYRADPGPPADLKPRWVERDDASRRLADFLVATTPRGAGEIPAEYLRPERFDPLGFDVRAGLLALPRPTDAPALVAALQDGLLSLVRECIRYGRLDAAALAWRLLEGGPDERLTEGGATVLRPRDPLAAEAGLADREALGGELRRVVATRDVGLRSRLRLHAALYTGRFPWLSDAGYVAPLRWIFGAISNDPPAGAMALGGTALAAGATEIDVARPPFDRLVRDGVVRGWLRFEGPPGASDLDRAPSSVLAAIGDARLACALESVPVVARYGKGSATAEAKLGFGGEDAEAVGAFAARPYTLLPKGSMTDARRQRFMQSDLDTDALYAVGRRETLAVTIRLRSGPRARLEFPRQIAERRDLTFAELPAEIQSGILRGAQATLEHPPASVPPTVMPDPSG